MPNAPAPKHPNLVFVLPDRLRQDSMACYGNDWIQSPHMNALAERSLVFENAYVTQPVCAPARSSIMTGLYPPSAGMSVNRLVMPREVQAAAEMVSSEYKTGYVGKWHLGDEIFAQHRFDHWVGSNDKWWPEYTDHANRTELSAYHHFLKGKGIEPDEVHPGGMTYSGKLRSELPPELQMATFLGHQAADFIESNANNPFVLYVSSIEPHPPFAGPYDDLYDAATMPVDETFLAYPEQSTLFNRLRADLFANCIRDGIDLREGEAAWRRLRAGYWGNVKVVDDMLGSILGGIERAGVADNTIIVFTSEHGDMVGTHGMLEMRTPYEEAARVPLLMHVPWLEDGARRVPGNFSQIDILPTLLDLMGESLPDQLQGVSRKAVVDGDDTLANNDIVVQHNGVGDRNLADECDEYFWPEEKLADLNFMNSQPWRSIITADRWKLNLCATDLGELYDLNADPAEQANLFDEPEHRDRIRAMAARLRLWQVRSGDTAPLPGV
ncbi:MAG: sulfatase-like hydrolase/transferase [Chloroflexi bacterium]|nr:sulfatase-like hydrolase/transferase [Chloroflexota bacterium]